VNGGKFVEAVLKCLHFLRTGNEVDSLDAGQEIDQLQRNNILEPSERLTIPRTLRVIYEHRNRRGGAHNSSFDPTKMDAMFVVAASDWVMEELTRLYLTSDSGSAQALVQNLLVKDLALVEEIDGDYLILKPELSARIQIELILYKHYPNRCTTKDLVRWVHNHKENNVRATLRGMKARSTAHENEAGWKLTEAGVTETEAEIAKLQHDTVNSAKMTITKPKGVERGRRR
jgi:predicted transcriptional regulator with HTH domain